jgi:beta-lactamase class D
MIKKVLFTFMCAFFVHDSMATTQCFIAKENGKIVKQMGECDKRHTPASTFKIPLAVMGFDAGILKNPLEPSVPFSKEIVTRLGALYMPDKYPIMRFYDRPHTPTSWMQYSVIWYSQYITHKLAETKVQNYLNHFNYGNKDISGTPGKKDGLLTSWIFNSLQISPLEQLDFIDKLHGRKLPASRSAQENTIKIIQMDNIWDNWTLHGKTGGGMAAGWFIGWIEKDNRSIVFVQYVEPENSLISGGIVARELAKSNLITLMFK